MLLSLLTGKRLHPVFLAIKTSLKTSLQDYLASGQVDRLWLENKKMVKQIFSNETEIFININNPDTIIELEAKGNRQLSPYLTPIP